VRYLHVIRQLPAACVPKAWLSIPVLLDESSYVAHGSATCSESDELLVQCLGQTQLRCFRSEMYHFN